MTEIFYMQLLCYTYLVAFESKDAAISDNNASFTSQQIQFLLSLRPFLLKRYNECYTKMADQAYQMATPLHVHRFSTLGSKKGLADLFNPNQKS